MGNALDHLSFGDAVNERMRLDRAPAAQIADDLGISGSAAAKASWLARVYSPADRQRLGHAVLRTLGSSHLEAVARVSEPDRTSLLKRAAAEGLAVRALKELADSTALPRRAGVAVIGVPEVARAVDTYLAFDDARLERLLAGPNGATIKRLAQSGAELAARIAEHTTT